MRFSAITVLVLVLVAATIMALGYAAINEIPYNRAPDHSCGDHEIALLVWGVLSGLVITFLGTVILAWLKSPIGAYWLLVGALTLVAGIGFTMGVETHEFCGRESWWKEGALMAGFTFLASVAGLAAGYLWRVNP